MIQQIFLYILIFIISAYLLYKIIEKHLISAYYYQKVDHFRKFPIQPGDIVFLGDSITDFGPWEEIFPEYPVKNRGISADTVKGVYKRIDQIIEGKPSIVFLLIGTNDLGFWLSHNDRFIIKYYRMILQEFREKTPLTKVYIQSIFPRHKSFSKRIIRLNKNLEELASSYGYEFIDLFSHMANEQGALKDQLSNDHLHLMAEGYQIWTDVIRPFFPNKQ